VRGGVKGADEHQPVKSSVAIEFVILLGNYFRAKEQFFNRYRRLKQQAGNDAGTRTIFEFLMAIGWSFARQKTRLLSS